MNKFNIGDKVVIVGGSIFGSTTDKGKKGVVKNFYKRANTDNYRYAVLIGTNYSTYQEESLRFKKEKPKRKELIKRIEELEEIKLKLIKIHFNKNVVVFGNQRCLCLPLTTFKDEEEADMFGYWLDEESSLWLKDE